MVTAQLNSTKKKNNKSYRKNKKFNRVAAAYKFSIKYFLFLTIIFWKKAGEHAAKGRIKIIIKKKDHLGDIVPKPVIPFTKLNVVRPPRPLEVEPVPLCSRFANQ